MRSVAISASDHEFLRQRLFTNDGKENAALLVCGVADTEQKHELLVREVVLVPKDAYTQRLSDHLEVAPRSINSVVDKCMKKGFGIMTVHSHPMSDAAHYSRSDDAGEERLFTVFSDLLGRSKHGSLLFTESETIGRFPSPKGFAPLERLRIIGSRLVSVSPGRTSIRSDVTSQAMPDRQILAFGRQGQNLLESLRIGVVGLGGTGSVVTEQLVRLGINKFVLIEPDKFEKSNLSRLYGSRLEDTTKSHLKVEILARLIRSVSPSADLTIVPESVVKQSVLLKLRDCEIVFACTDNDWSRSVLNRFAYQYLIPVVDIGIRITVKDNVVQGIGGRVARVGPDTACLRCAHHLDPDRIRAESMPEERRRALAREHYIEGVVDNPAPAVISFNTTLSGFAVSELLLFTLGVGDTSRANELIFDGMEGVAFRARPTPIPDCDICSQAGLRGIGDLQVVSSYE